MPSTLYLTPNEPTTVSLSSANEVVLCTLSEAVDIGQFDWLDLEVVLLSATFVGGTSPSVTIGISTGLQLQTEDGWINNKAATGNTNANYDILLNQVAPSAGVSVSAVKSLGGMVPGANNPSPLLRYARWVVQANGAPTSATIVFYIRGMARRIAN
jgi:hypothetical protein